MIGERTGVDFSEHKLRIVESEDFLAHHFKIDNTYYGCLSFINTNGVMVVTGDYGNWMFCREFHPSAKGHVSGGYWDEKLQMASEQKSSKYDSKATEKELQEYMDKHNKVLNVIHRFKEINELDEKEDSELIEYLNINLFDSLIFEDTDEDYDSKSLEDIENLFDCDEFLSQDEFDYIETLLNCVDDELEYTYEAYRNSYNAGRFQDHEYVPFIETRHVWLNIVYDAWEAICEVIKEQENKLENIPNE